MRNFIENLSGLKIRNGYEKHIEKTLLFFNFNINNVSKQDAINVVKFINSSNSKMTESYYILRTKLIKSEYIKEIKKNAKKFSDCAYSNKSRNEVSSEFNKKYYSRGYSGWFILNDKKYYARSSIEFIYLQYLLNLYPNSIFKQESKVYYLPLINVSYKPDIFEYIDKKLVRIYEIKSSLNDFEDIKYIEFEKYAKTIGIEYVKLYKSNDIINEHLWIKNKLNEWKLKIKNNKSNISMDGQNNPMYGVKQKETTKKLIGDKCKIRNNNKEYKEKCSKSIKESYKNNPEIKIKISESRKNRFAKIREEYNLINPFEEKLCIICNKKFNVRINNNKQTCSGGCTLKNKLRNGFKRKSATPEQNKIGYTKKIINFL